MFSFVNNYLTTEPTSVQYYPMTKMTIPEGVTELGGMEGPVSLRYYMIQRGVSAEDIAALMEEKVQNVRGWAAGRYAPRRMQQHFLLSLAGIQIHEWLKSEDKQELERLRGKLAAIRRRRPVEEPSRVDRLAGRV
jgi:hypothetical protein